MSAGHGQPEMRNRTSKVQLRAQHHPVNVLTEERAFIGISLENVLRSVLCWSCLENTSVFTAIGVNMGLRKLQLWCLHQVQGKTISRLGLKLAAPATIETWLHHVKPRAWRTSNYRIEKSELET